MTRLRYSREQLEHHGIQEVLRKSGIDAEPCRLDRLKYFRPEIYQHLCQAHQSSYVSRGLMDEVKLSDEAARCVLAFGGMPIRNTEAQELYQYSRPDEEMKYPRVLRRLPDAELPELPAPAGLQPPAPPVVNVQVTIDSETLAKALTDKLVVNVAAPAAAAPDAGTFDVIVERDQNGAVTRYRKIRRRV